MLKFIRNKISKCRIRLNLLAHLTAENLALRHQLLVLKRAQKRPHLKDRDRVFWIILRRIWPQWRNALVIVSPDTVVRWHRQGFRRYWRWKSRHRNPGRPKIYPETRELVIRMATENPLWGAPRIHGELLKLGFEVSERTVSNLMPRRPDGHRRQNWKTFLRTQAEGIVASDFIVVPTITFRLLYVFIIMGHNRREILHFGVTRHPTSQWAAQQTVTAFDWKGTPEYLIRDRDKIYGKEFRTRVLALKIQEVLTSYRSPWQNGFIERLNGSIRRECIDHIIIWNERHLRNVLNEYCAY